MTTTLLLDTVEWDLVPDLAGNIALASEPYSLAQDAASAIRLFQGELWYDTAKGIPYWASVLGSAPPVSVLKTYFENAALTVPGVVQAVCYLASFENRTVTGQVQVTDVNGNISAANF